MFSPPARRPWGWSFSTCPFCQFIIPPQLACAAARGFATLGPDSALNYVAQPLSEDGEKRTRFNDGACDSAGRFLAGTVMCQERNIPGHLYIHDPADGSCKMLDGPFTVSVTLAIIGSLAIDDPSTKQDSNGLGWSPDNKTLLVDSTPSNRIQFIMPLKQILYRLVG